MMPKDSPRESQRVFELIPLHNEPGPRAGRYASVFDDEQEVAAFDTGDAQYDERLALLLRTAPAALSEIARVNLVLQALVNDAPPESIRQGLTDLVERLTDYLDTPVHVGPVSVGPAATIASPTP